MTILLLVFATYWITLVLTGFDGPFGILYKFREVNGLGALGCFVCTSLYVAGALSLVFSSDVLSFALLTFGLAGAATLLNNVSID